MNDINITLIKHVSVNRKFGGLEVFEQNLFEYLSNNSKSVKSFYFKALVDKCNNSIYIYNYGNFFDLIFVNFLSIFKRNIICICHVNIQWKHISFFPFNLATSLMLRNKKIDYCLIVESQKKFIGKNSRVVGSFINNQFFSNNFEKSDSFKHYVLYLGRIDRDKNILFMIDCLFKSKFLNKKLILVGPISDSEYKKEIINFLIEINCLSKVIFLNPIYSINEKIRLIDNCDFGIYPSIYDTLPLTMLEFVSRNKVCFTSNISESVNLLEDRFLFDPLSKNELITKLDTFFSNQEVSNLFKPTIDVKNFSISNFVSKLLYPYA